MNHPESLERLEASTGRALRRALPRAEVPADVAGRIGERMQAAMTQNPATVVPFPRKTVRRPLRWAIGAAVAALIILTGGLGIDRLGQGRLPDANTLAAVAHAAIEKMPTVLQSSKNDVTFRLDTPLPVLPEQGTALTLAYRGEPGFYWLDPELEPQWDTPPGPPADLAEAERLATAWLKEHGHYPSGPVTVTSVHLQREPQVAGVYFSPAPGSEFETRNTAPMVYVAVNEGKVFTAMGSWPDGVAGKINVPLITAEQAWADLQAGNGVWIGMEVENKPFAYPPNPVLTVREIKLGRAQVHSTEDGHSYLIPVVVFEADVVDANGEVRRLSALVSAIRTEP
jgi:hypothetical protein